VPFALAPHAFAAILDRVGRSGEVPTFGVLKTFGDIRPVGLLSFPRPGVTLAMDFAHRGASTERLLADLDAIVADAGGALYPAKDARMSAPVFRTGFPEAERFARFIDPKASSGFWRRVTA
jgi:hypothetical protein